MEKRQDTIRADFEIIPEHYYHLWSWLESFLLDRKAQNLRESTVKYYREKLSQFAGFCDSREVKSLLQVDKNLIRAYLFYLGEKGHNPGGVRAHFRAVKAFVRFWVAEAEPDNYRSPFLTLKMPRDDAPVLDAARMDDIAAMLSTCADSRLDFRDKAIIMVLIDTGCRAGELVGMNTGDLDMESGSILVTKSKSRTWRRVFIGEDTRAAIGAWLSSRLEESEPLFTSRTGQRLGYDSLLAIIRRRAKLAGVKAPKLHSFRRAFALAMLRGGTDLYTLKRLMGHSNIETLKRYLALVDDDLQRAHKRAGPVDNLLKGER